MKRLICALFALLMTFTALAAEADHYEDIAMSDTLNTLSARYGTVVPDGDGMANVDGILCAFYQSGRLWAKARDFESVKDVAMLTRNDFDPVKKLRQGETLENVQLLLDGEGTEILRLNLSDEANSGLQRVLAWRNADGDVLEVMFELDDGKWVLFAAVQIPGEG